MRNHNRSFWQALVSSPFMFVAGLIILVLLGRATWNIHKSDETVSVKTAETQAEIDRLEVQKTDLTSKIDQLSSPDGIESELRTKYRGTKEGESVAVILDDSASTSSTSSGNSAGSGSEANSTSGQSWWGRIWGAIGL